MTNVLKILHHLMGSLFADDLQGILEIALEDLQHGISLANSDVNRINDWLVSRGLQLSAIKSEVMIIGSKANIDRIDFTSINKLQVSGVDLEYCKTKKNLGVIFDEHFTFEAHNEARIQKAYSVLNRINIVTALVHPVLDYGNVVSYGWGVYSTLYSWCSE